MSENKRPTSWPAAARMPLEWGPWPLWLAIVAYAGYAVVSVAASFLALLVPEHLVASWPLAAQQALILVAAVLVPCLALRRFAPSHLGLRRVSWWQVVIGVAAFIAVFTVAERIWAAASGNSSDNVGDLQAMGMGKSPLAELGIILAICILAPIAEELLFRGLLYRTIRDGIGRWNKPAGIVAGLLLAGFGFADAHGGENVDVGLFGLFMLMASLFTLLYEWTGSLLAPIIAHSANNSLVVVVAAMNGAMPSNPALIGLAAVAPVVTAGLAVLLRRHLPTIGTAPLTS